MSTTRASFAAAGPLLVAACFFGDASDAAGDEGVHGGVVEGRWIGADTGAMTAAGAARWCHEQRRLQITAARGDTGLGIALYLEGDRPAPGTFRVVNTLAGDSSVPRAATAARWLEPTLLRGFQGRRGTVTMRAVEEGRISGTFETDLHAATGQDSVRMVGSFTEVPLSRMTLGCEAPIAGPAADSGVN